MLGQAISMVLPEVVGFKLTGKLPEVATATDLVLTATQMLRAKGVVGKFVEFFGPGCANLSIADRATISNMAPEYGATIGYFPPDPETIEYLKTTGRDADKLKYIQAYFEAQGVFRNYTSGVDPVFTSLLELDLSTVEPVRVFFFRLTFLSFPLVILTFRNASACRAPSAPTTACSSPT